MNFRTKRPFPSSIGSTPVVGSGRKRAALLAMAEDFIQSVKIGANEGGDIELLSTSADGAVATAALELDGTAGTVTTTINGVAVNADFDTDDIVTAGLLAAAINASSNSLVQNYVRANNLSATIALASVVAGTQLSICGVSFTATASATGNQGEFSISGNNTADAAALVAAINTHPALVEWVWALNSTNVVFLFPRFTNYDSEVLEFSWPTGPYAPPNAIVNLSQAATLTISSGNALVASEYVGISANTRGYMFNAVTIAASGGDGNISVVNSQVRLLNGAGGQTAVVRGV